MKNSTKVWLLFIGLCFFTLGVGYQIGGRPGLLLAFVISVLSLLVLAFFDESYFLDLMKATELKGQDSWGLREIVFKASDRLNMKAPHLFLISKHDAPIIFSCVIGNRSSYIALSEKLIQKLSKEEIEALLVRQTCSIHFWNRWPQRALSRFLMSWSAFAQSLQKNLKFTFAPDFLHHVLMWPFYQFIVSPKLQLKIDDLCGELLHDKQALASGLWKTAHLCELSPPFVPVGTEPFWSYVKKGPQVKLFPNTEANLERRIRRLIGYFPI
jgi:Zn-dependent protease with chaperone function